MKRVHIVEFEDLSWFPSWLRTCMTNVIAVLCEKMGVTGAVAKLAGRALKENGLQHVVDLGSGGGGPMPEVVESLRGQEGMADVTLEMTDLYPNLDAMEKFNSADRPHIQYRKDPVDATDLASAPAGLKTMMNCFHHMKPDMARTILKSARDSRQPLLIYELADNKIPFVVWAVMLPLALPLVGAMVWFLTPMVRPLTVRQLVFTYLVPIIPIFYAWDGQASYPRIYTFSDLDELLQGLDGPGYRWEKGYATKDDGNQMGTYLLGMPTAEEHSEG